MKAVIQRVRSAEVRVEKDIVGKIQHGLLILLGIGQEDSEDDIRYLVHKIAQMRIFGDENGKMNLDIRAIDGSCLVVSQFTLYASTKKGNRPSFIEAASPYLAIPLYEKFCEQLSHAVSKPVEKGIFGADMKVSLTNEGPVTIIIDSRDRS